MGSMGWQLKQRGLGGLAKDTSAPGGRLNPIKASKQMLANDVETMQKSPWEFGLSDSQKTGMVDRATAAMRSQLNQTAAQMNRAGISRGGDLAGRNAGAIRGLLDTEAQAAAGASGQAQTISQQMIMQEEARIRAELDAARARRKEANQQVGKAAGTIGLMGATAVTGGIAGGASGVAAANWGGVRDFLGGTASVLSNQWTPGAFTSQAANDLFPSTGGGQFGTSEGGE